MIENFSIIFITLSTICVPHCLAVDTCGEWKAYKDEKCFKVFVEKTVNYDDAVKTCALQNNSGSLAIIRSKDEQDFVTNFLFNDIKIPDNVWIGIRKLSLNFTRVDNLDIRYTNWSPGSPKNESDYNCVQMIADKALVGKWINEPCGRKNAVLCEKLQVWSFEHMQQVLMEERYQLREKINILEQNPEPIGFIYVQLPGQNEPKLFWPTVKWEDASSTYAGLFFRVLGGNSSTFETEQSENDRYLKSVQYNHTDKYAEKVETLLNGQWSAPLFSGAYTSSAGSNYAHEFQITTGEIRPRNKAVKIWKRIG